MEIGFPEGVSIPTGFGALRWSRHALLARNNDRNGHILAPTSIDFGKCVLIEVDIEDNEVVKYLVRTSQPFDRVNDVIFALRPLGDSVFLVKTVWLNQKNDLHRTLDKSRYNKVG